MGDCAGPNGVGLAGKGSTTLESMNESFLLMCIVSLGVSISTLTLFRLKTPMFFMDSVWDETRVSVSSGDG